MSKKEQKRQTKSSRAGLCLPVGRIGRKIRTEIGTDNRGRGMRVQESAIVYATSVLETILLEVMENAKNEMKGKTLKPSDLYRGIEKDKELRKLFDGHFLKGGGNDYSFIQRIVLDKKK